MRQKYDDFKKNNAEILAICSDDIEDVCTLKEKLDLPFPLLADPELKVIHQYGVFHYDEPEGRKIARPSVFAVDKDTKIHYSYIGKDPYDRPSVEELLKIAERLK